MTALIEMTLDMQLILALSCISVILLWCSHHITFRHFSIPTGGLSYALMLLLALIYGHIALTGLLWIGLMLLSGVLYQRRVYSHVMLVVMLLLGFALASHSLSGFENMLLLDQVRLSESSTPYTLRLGIDKISAGLVIFYFVFSVKERSEIDLRKWLPVLPVLVIAIVLSILLALMSMLKVDVKLSQYFLLFAIHNLLFTCMAEEAYFRGLIHKQLNRYLHYSIGIAVSAILFGLAHYGAGRIDYVFSAMVAGVGYAYVYHRTGSLSASMLSHWLLNLIHFIFFTYPFYQAV